MGSEDGTVTSAWLGAGSSSVFSTSVDLLQHRGSPVCGLDASSLRPDIWLACSEDQCISVWQSQHGSASTLMDFFATSDRYPAAGTASVGLGLAAPAMHAMFSTIEEHILLFAGQVIAPCWCRQAACVAYI